MGISSSTNRRNFKFSKAGRIRVVVGSFAICLGWMEYITPSTSTKFEWLRRLAIQALGESGYVLVLILIGLFSVSWAVIDAELSRREEK
jgi:hypothetical protein